MKKTTPASCTAVYWCGVLLLLLLLLSQAADRSANEREEGLVACSDHGSDALMWAAGRGDSEIPLLKELITLSGGGSINRESHHGDTALTMACSR